MDIAGFPQYLLLDGGLSTELAWVHGYKEIDDDPLWSSRLLKNNPSAIHKVHASFLDAGAQIIETATYQASVEGFMEHLGLSEENAKKLITEGANIAIRARDMYWEKQQTAGTFKPLVAGSVGPYGAHLHDGSEYTGAYVDKLSVEDLREWHRPTVEALLKADIDILAFETIPAQKEAEAIISLLRELPTAKAWISFSCRDSNHTSHNDNFSEAVAFVASSDQIVGIGINCTPPDIIESLLDGIPVGVKQRKRIIVYPNSGETWTSEKTWSGKDQCDKLTEYVQTWMEKGACWIGGCCRVTSNDISDMNKAITNAVATSKSNDS